MTSLVVACGAPDPEPGTIARLAADAPSLRLLVTIEEHELVAILTTESASGFGSSGADGCPRLDATGTLDGQPMTPVLVDPAPELHNGWCGQPGFRFAWTDGGPSADAELRIEDGTRVIRTRLVSAFGLTHARLNKPVSPETEARLVLEPSPFALRTPFRLEFEPTGPAPVAADAVVTTRDGIAFRWPASASPETQVVVVDVAAEGVRGPRSYEPAICEGIARCQVFWKRTTDRRTVATTEAP